MLLVSVSGTILFRPSQTVFFDLYPGAGSEARGRQPVKNMSNVSSLCNTMGKNNTGGTRQNSGYLADSVDVMDPRRVGDENDDGECGLRTAQERSNYYIGGQILIFRKFLSFLFECVEMRKFHIFLLKKKLFRKKSAILLTKCL